MQKKTIFSAISALAELLHQVFVPLERIHAWLPTITHDSEIIDNLASRTPAALANEVANALDKHGWLKTEEFWAKLEEKAANPRKPDVQKVRDQFRVVYTSTSSPIIILFIANRANDEFRKISDALLDSQYRDIFHLEQINATSFGEIRGALFKHEPHVLHISAQSDEDGALILEKDGKESQRISKIRTLQLLTALPGRLRLVFFNAFHSLAIARDLTPKIDLTIGMNMVVPDADAIEFVVAFYQSLAHGKTVEESFRIASAWLEEPEEKAPRLFPLPDQDPNNKRGFRFTSPS